MSVLNVQEITGINQFTISQDSQIPNSQHQSPFTPQSPDKWVNDEIKWLIDDFKSSELKYISELNDLKNSLNYLLDLKNENISSIFYYNQLKLELDLELDNLKLNIDLISNLIFLHNSLNDLIKSDCSNIDINSFLSNFSQWCLKSFKSYQIYIDNYDLSKNDIDSVISLKRRPLIKIRYLKKFVSKLIELLNHIQRDPNILSNLSISLNNFEFLLNSAREKDKLQKLNLSNKKNIEIKLNNVHNLIDLNLISCKFNPNLISKIFNIKLSLNHFINSKFSNKNFNCLDCELILHENNLISFVKLNDAEKSLLFPPFKKNEFTLFIKDNNEFVLSPNNSFIGYNSIENFNKINLSFKLIDSNEFNEVNNILNDLSNTESNTHIHEYKQFVQSNQLINYDTELNGLKIKCDDNLIDSNELEFDLKSTINNIVSNDPDSEIESLLNFENDQDKYFKLSSIDDLNIINTVNNKDSQLSPSDKEMNFSVYNRSDQIATTTTTNNNNIENFETLQLNDKENQPSIPSPKKKMKRRNSIFNVLNDLLKISNSSNNELPKAEKVQEKPQKQEQRQKQKQEEKQAHQIEKPKINPYLNLTVQETDNLINMSKSLSQKVKISYWNNNKWCLFDNNDIELTIYSNIKSSLKYLIGFDSNKSMIFSFYLNNSASLRKASVNDIHLRLSYGLNKDITLLIRCNNSESLYKSIEFILSDEEPEEEQEQENIKPKENFSLSNSSSKDSNLFMSNSNSFTSNSSSIESMTNDIQRFGKPASNIYNLSALSSSPSSSLSSMSTSSQKFLPPQNKIYGNKNYSMDSFTSTISAINDNKNASSSTLQLPPLISKKKSLDNLKNFSSSLLSLDNSSIITNKTIKEKNILKENTFFGEKEYLSFNKLNNYSIKLYELDLNGNKTLNIFDLQILRLASFYNIKNNIHLILKSEIQNKELIDIPKSSSTISLSSTSFGTKPLKLDLILTKDNFKKLSKNKNKIYFNSTDYGLENKLINNKFKFDYLLEFENKKQFELFYNAILNC
ncbi:hypothetical protein BVG19_g3882 [[Candida] boidinii]|nr:hypothetical protein BVG19_g3882 [[Candida] boidinii]OWB52660.1 hypothetical protein B5S27_g4239 [[Candida] boidinii]